MNLFEYATAEADEEREEQSTFEKSHLTPRQQKLRAFFYAHTEKKWKNQREQVSDYEHWLFAIGRAKPKYSYNFFQDEKDGVPDHNMTSLRQFRKDLETLRKSGEVQKIITRNGYAHSEKEALTHLQGVWAHILPELQTYYAEKKKLAADGQQRLVFGGERAEIQAILQDDQN